MKTNAATPSNTESADNYLKIIHVLSGPEGQRVTSNAIAERLGIRAASVTGMLQKLAAGTPALVRYEKHYGVRLTGAGRKRAIEVLRHHRLLERFLHDVLDYTWDEVHEEAERLEHFISEKFEDRIAAKLGDPLTDPHGHIIPEKNGAVSERAEVTLKNWACGIPAVVSSVSDRDPSALREMERLGLRPGIVLTVEAGVRSSSLFLRVEGKSEAVRISQLLASQIFVASARRYMQNATVPECAGTWCTSPAVPTASPPATIPPSAQATIRPAQHSSRSRHE